jgi:hypothetical protein
MEETGRVVGRDPREWRRDGRDGLKRQAIGTVGRLGRVGKNTVENLDGGSGEETGMLTIDMEKERKMTRANGERLRTVIVTALGAVWKACIGRWKVKRRYVIRRVPGRLG